MRLTHFECSQYSSFLLWKQMGVEGEDPKNTALLTVLCYSAVNSAHLRLEDHVKAKGNLTAALRY